MKNEQIETMITQIMQGDESGAMESFTRMMAKRADSEIQAEKAPVMDAMFGESASHKE